MSPAPSPAPHNGDENPNRMDVTRTPPSRRQSVGVKDAETVTTPGAPTPVYVGVLCARVTAVVSGRGLACTCCLWAFLAAYSGTAIALRSHGQTYSLI